tara:strand:+ start:245 stop:385 length:141 start_codon:yes stop_codon:yes gene_type:complete
MNEFQIITYSGFLALTAITMIFFGINDDDDDDRGMMRPILQRVYKA